MSKRFMNSVAVFVLTLNMLKYFELRIMLTQQENLYYQVNSGRQITFVNKLAVNFKIYAFSSKF